ncbi:MAG: (d)CMP kinase [Flavobacteriaceae bacterium]
MKKIIIAIDGHASTGKSTQAKRLAQRFQYLYINTGAMYRALTYYAVKEQLSPSELIAALPQLSISFSEKEGQQKTLLNGQDITSKLHQMEVAEQVSAIAALPEVRAYLLLEQRKIGAQKGVVMDGRDIGTVIFPEAECKFFLNASIEVRAQRRCDELALLGTPTPYESVLENLRSRDQMDSSRAVAPLLKAADAMEIDVSDFTLEEVYQQMEKRVLSVLAS